MSFFLSQDSRCNVDGCTRSTKAKGLCNAHYLRQSRTGTVGAAIPVGTSSYRGSRIAAAKTGTHYTRHVESFNKPNQQGENHWNWKGGITPATKLERQKFAQSVRVAVLTRDNYTCTVCQLRGGDLHVDHIVAWADNLELRFDPDNCRTLCVPCHYYVTFKRKLNAPIKWGQHLEAQS